MLSLPPAVLPEFALRCSYENILIGQVGLTLDLYYTQDMDELHDTFRAAFDLYQAFVPADTLNFYCSSDEWRPYKPRSLNRLFNRFKDQGVRGHWLDFARIEATELDEESGDLYALDEVGPYGLNFAGFIKARNGSFCDTGVSQIRCEFPHDELLRCGPEAFIDFAAQMAALAPFDSGHAGFSFKWNTRTTQDEELAWMSFKAPRFLALFPYMSKWGFYTRHHLAHVGWLTLLGSGLTEAMGGAATLRHGAMLIAGDTPPLGDVNQRAPDIGPLREVARLTRPHWLATDRLKSSILNYMWFDTDAREAWINRFEH